MQEGGQWKQKKEECGWEAFASTKASLYVFNMSFFSYYSNDSGWMDISRDIRDYVDFIP